MSTVGSSFDVWEGFSQSKTFIEMYKRENVHERPADQIWQYQVQDRQYPDILII